MFGDVVCDAGEVELVAVEDDAVENIGVGVPGAGEERSQWRIAPSEPPETRIGCTGCHARAVSRLRVADALVLGQENKDSTYSKLPSCALGGRPILSCSECRRLVQFGHVMRLRASFHAEPTREIVWYSYVDG